MRELTEADRAALRALRERAELAPVGILVRDTPEARAQFNEQMMAQTVEVWDLVATMTLETGHPAGPYRLLSVSGHGSLPAGDDVWLIAEQLGFAGDLMQCSIAAIEGDERDSAATIILRQWVNVVGRPPLAFDEADQPGEFRIEWRDGNKQPRVAPNPAFPHGLIMDVAEDGAPACWVNLPYPFRGIGAVRVQCLTCGRAIALTTAGRPDDPRRLRLPCGNSELAEVRRSAFPAPH